MKVKALIVYKDDTRAGELARELYRNLLGKGIETTISQGNQLGVDNCQPADIVFVLGGDGTILKTARCLSRWATPVLGVNLGKVGFLSSIEPHELMAVLDKVIKKEYQLEQRLMVDATLIRNSYIVHQGTALNDIVIRSSVPHTINISLQVDGRHYTTFLGDGVICATPTGSTAYSFSAGGPIIDVALPALVITPICAQLAYSRPLVVSAACSLEFTLDSDRNTGLSIDGKEEIALQKGDQIKVDKSTMVTNIIQLDSVSCAEKIFIKSCQINDIGSAWE